jgi:succinoglycan biosynthesis protein ExoV
VLVVSGSRVPRNSMLYYSNYFKLAHGNFGDDLNPWLWSRLAPEVCNQSDPALFLGIGTILTRSVPPEPVKVVFGSGCGSQAAPDVDRRWFIYGVRGPLTAAKLNLDPALALGDPAILVRRIALSSCKKIFPLSFMPHHQSAPEAGWNRLCQRAGLHYIDPRSSVDEVLLQIRQSELLVAEAMHGAIAADALRVPWIPVRIYGNFMEFKWRDWAESVQAPLHIANVPPVFDRQLVSKKGFVHAFKKVAATAGIGKAKWKRLQIRPSTEREVSESLRALEKVSKTSKPCLSPDNSIGQAETRLSERLAELREDWKCGRFSLLAQKPTNGGHVRAM